MTSCSRGDIVLGRFVFADEKGAKQRPGLIGGKIGELSGSEMRAVESTLREILAL